MAVTFPKSDEINDKRKGGQMGNGFHDFDEHESIESDEDDDSGSPGPLGLLVGEHPRVAIALDNGCVRICDISDTDEFILVKSLPPVKGEVFLKLFVLQQVSHLLFESPIKRMFCVVVYRTSFKCDLEYRC